MTTLADVGRGVISERRELHATGWKDCTQASAMRCCADAGIVFPLDDLDLEREALERSDSYPDETGAPMWAIVEAMERRYGYSGEPVTDLHAALRTPGYTLLVQGKYSDFPTYQRRWSPSGTFGHSVAYRVESDLGGTLLDPQAPMGFAGDAVTPAVMEAFAWGASTTRAMKWKDNAVLWSSKIPVLIDLPVRAQLCTETGAPLVKVSVASLGVVSPFELELSVNAHYRACFVTTAGEHRLAFIHTPDANVRPIPVTDCTAAVAAAVAPVRAALTAAQAKIAAAKTANATAATAHAAVTSALG